MNHPQSRTVPVTRPLLRDPDFSPSCPPTMRQRAIFQRTGMCSGDAQREAGRGRYLQGPAGLGNWMHDAVKPEITAGPVHPFIRARPCHSCGRGLVFDEEMKWRSIG